MNIKVNFDNIKVKETKKDFTVKILMLKGEKGEQGDLNPSHIVDNLTSNDSSKVLSAKQGKVLKDLVDDNTTKINKKPYYFNTVADMKAYNLSAGDMAITKGYYSANDGGGAEYNIVATTSNYSETLNNTLKAELIIKDSANVKQFGAKGDGTTDDKNAFTNAINSSSSIYVPEGDYKLLTSITLSKSTKIFGNSTIKTWGGHNKTTIISPASDYAFKCSWGNSNDFENLTFDGYGLSAPSSCYINHCEFKGSIGILSARVATITNCSFNNCTTAGIQQITDTKVLDSFFYNNEIAINMQNSNDNMIDSNKIEWNTNGIVIDTQVFNLITNNIFDRQTEYGIKMINGANTTIDGNQFERNLLGHIYMSGTRITINNNILLEKNSEDDQSGEVVPQVSIVVNSVSHSIVENNTYTTERLFSTSFQYRLNLKQKNNNWMRNNNIQNTTGERIKIGTLSVPANSSDDLYVSWSNIGYLHCNGYDVTIDNVEYRLSNASQYGENYITEVKNSFNSGVTIKITNPTSSDISGDIYITLTAFETTKI